VSEENQKRHEESVSKLQKASRKASCESLAKS